MGWRKTPIIDRAAVTTEEVAAKQRIIPAGGGDNYDWANDHVYVKAPLEVSDGRVTLVEDTLKPGFLLARHHHRTMLEIFYILDGVVTFTYDDEVVEAAAGSTVIVPPGVWHIGADRRVGFGLAGARGTHCGASGESAPADSGRTATLGRVVVTAEVNCDRLRPLLRPSVQARTHGPVRGTRHRPSRAASWQGGQPGHPA